MASDKEKQRYEPVGDIICIFRRGRRWYANFQLNGKQQRPSLGTTSKKEARRRAIQLEAEIIEGRYQRKAPPASLAAVVTDYKQFLQTEGRADKTLIKYTMILDRLLDLAGRRGVYTVNDVNLKFMDAYRAERVQAGAAPKTVYTESVVVRQLVNFGLSRDLLVVDPLKGLKLKKPRPSRQPCWTYEQVQQILGVSPLEIVPALTLLAETGMRFGELAWLTWDDIDFTANVLRVQPKDGWKPKTGDQRAVPLNAQLQRLLMSLPKRWRWVMTMPPSPRCPLAGRQWTERRLLAVLKRVLKTLKLPGKLHTFRHTFISNALLKGTPVTLVREWVGHVDEQVLKLYTHVHNEASQAAMQRLAEANYQLQQTENDCNGVSQKPAQSQHSNKEENDERDAK
jgi:integrase